MVSYKYDSYGNIKQISGDLVVEPPNVIVEHAFEAAYFLLENLTSDLIGLLF